MNFFKNVVNKLFDKEEEAILNDCIAFDEAGLVFTVFIRGEIPRERLKFVFQEYIRQKQWYLRHNGPASMTAYQNQPEKRTIQIKIGFTGEKERIMQFAWSSPSIASSSLFRDLMMEFTDLLSSQCMLKLQTKPVPAFTAPVDLRDIVEEEMRPVEYMKPEEAMKVMRSSSTDAHGLSDDKKALAEQVLFEEDDESGAGIFRVVCQLNNDAKVAYLNSILANVANGLDCTSFTIQKEKTKATVKVLMRTGLSIELAMTVGINEQKRRVLHGTYPEAQATYGRTFWIRFAESLATQGLLLGQRLAIPSRPITPGTNAVGSPIPNSQSPEGDAGDDSGLEYDSGHYDSSEQSVDSDAE